MFKKILQKLSSLADDRNKFDPSSLGDPVATQTDWTPAKRGGASFRTHKLIKVSPDRIEFRASIGAKVFYMIFLVVGIGVVIGVSALQLSKGTFSFSMDTVFPLLIGLVFAVIGGYMLYFGTVPIVFDKRKGYFWKGRKGPDQVFSKNSLKYFAELEDVHALQLISEYCRGDKSSYYSYELNLVLKDGKRINVVDHGNQNKLRADASTLSDLLERPVWDAIA